MTMATSEFKIKVSVCRELYPSFVALAGVSCCGWLSWRRTGGPSIKSVYLMQGCLADVPLLICCIAQSPISCWCKKHISDMHFCCFLLGRETKYDIRNCHKK